MASPGAPPDLRELTRVTDRRPAAGGAVASGGLPMGVTRGLEAAQRRRGRADGLLALAIGLVLSAVALGTDGGPGLGSKTVVELCLLLGGTALALGGLVLHRGDTRTSPLQGLPVLTALIALAVLSALSITWSVQPAESWLQTNETLAYAAAFAAALGLVRLVPRRFNAVLLGLALMALVVSAYALLTKIFPGWLAPDEQFARLREPFDYWNAVGLTAALGVPPLLWLAARRSGHAALNATAYPGLGLLLTVLMLSVSRGALLALLVGLTIWFALVPLRLRGAAALVCGIAGAAILTAWAFGDDALSTDRVVLEAREEAGLEFGLLTVLVLTALLVCGLAVGFRTAMSSPSPRTRRMVGRGIVGFLLALPIAGVVGLATAEGGIDGQVSKAWRSMTAAETDLPPNTPKRLTTTASERSRYWREAIDVFADDELKGAGAGAFGVARKLHRQAEVNVRHAHGYLPQTLADLGLVGLLVSLAALAAFLAAALRTCGLRSRAERARPYTPERIALLTMLSVVVVFGVHSAVDWTWSIPGTAVPALLCAGWLAGRGPVLAGRTVTVADFAPGPRARGTGRTAPALVAAAGTLIALVAAWGVLQPLRAEQASDAAYERLDAGDRQGALAQARTAIDRNPLAVEPLFELASIQSEVGDRDGALATLQEATRVQPRNPDPWRRLGRFLMLELARTREALPVLRRAYVLDPNGTEAISDVLEAERRLDPRLLPPGAIPPPQVDAP